MAGNGRPGGPKQMSGKGGADLVIPVPPGTVVSLLQQDETPQDTRTIQLLPMPEGHHDLPLVADLTKPGERLELCAGGRGGKGNMHFKSSVNQAPRHFQPGESGTSGQFLLELKSMADVGLVGYPNAGKSTLLSRLSNAQPKIAPYPFTTLAPMVGVVEFDDLFRMTVADIPGLIEGAHQGVGLGYEFLRHIERCRLLLFVLDAAGSEGRDPREDYLQLRKELKLYRADLAQRPYLIVANKADLPESAALVKKLRARLRKPIHVISAREQTGLEELRQAIRTALTQHSTTAE
jgi:GTP-binding protein